MRPEYLFFAVFGAFVLYFAWRFLRGGSLVGALLGGSVEHECGEISLGSSSVHSQRLKVYAMKSPDGGRFVGVAIVAKAPLAASMTPFKLSCAQAEELAELLKRASGANAVA